MQYEKYTIDQYSFLECRVINQFNDKAEHSLQPSVRPAVLLVPGGGYSMISQLENEPVALHFLTNGFSVFTLHYATGDESEYPTPLLELYYAIRYLRENMNKWHIQKNALILCGFSAGAHLAALGAAKYKLNEFDEVCDSDHDLIRPDGLIIGYPITDMRPLIENGWKHIAGWSRMLTTHLDEINVNAFVTADMPPVFLWHTRTDGIVPVSQSLMLAEVLEKNKVPYEMHIFYDGFHGLSTNDVLSNYQGVKQGGYIPFNVQYWIPMAVNWIDHLFDFNLRKGEIGISEDGQRGINIKWRESYV